MQETTDAHPHKHIQLQNPLLPSKVNIFYKLLERKAITIQIGIDLKDNAYSQEIKETGYSSHSSKPVWTNRDRPSKRKSKENGPRSSRSQIDEGGIYYMQEC